MIDFRSYEEQINILKTRGLTIPDEQLAIEILKQNNYYYLISGSTTVKHKGNGLCVNCYATMLRHKKEVMPYVEH